MSQRNVERVIGRLITDEGFRRRFSADPRAALEDLTSCGLELTGIELVALASIDPSLPERFADAIDPRIQRADIRTDLPGGLH